MVSGSANMLTVGGFRFDTEIVTVSEAVPPGPVTVIVYVAVVEGKTSREPFRATLPTPLSMVAVSALVALQDSVVDAPAIIDSGFAEILTIGVGCVTVTATDSVAVPPGPVTVIT
jgi:hypothetical protein